MANKRGTHGVANPIGTLADFKRALHSRGALEKGLLHNRERLNASAVPTILQPLLKVPIYATVLTVPPFPTRYENIKPRRALPPAELDVELLWTATILGSFTPEIQDYVIRRDTFYHAITAARFEDASDVLNEIEQRHGVSIWLMFSRMLLVHQSRGIAAQKQYLAEIIDSPKINAFVAALAFYFSYGLEDNVSVPELNRELDQLAVFGGSRSDVIAYFRYHASPLGLSEVASPLNCITLEENSPLIDRFETFLEMSQLLWLRAKGTVVPGLAQSLEMLAGIPDIRLQNLRTLLRPLPLAVNDPDFLRACESYSAGNNAEVAALWGYSQSQTAAAAWWYELAASLPAPPEEPEEVSPHRNSLSEEIVSGFRRVLNLRQSGPRSDFALQKLALRARKQPAARCIAAFLERTTDLSITDAVTENQSLWAISSPLENPKHFPVINRLNGEIVSHLEIASAAFAPNCAMLHSWTMDVSADRTFGIMQLDLPDARKLLYVGHHLFRREDFYSSLVYYKAHRQLVPDGAVRLADRCLYVAYRKLGATAEAFSLVVDSYLQDPATAGLFPLEDLASWAVVTSADSQLLQMRAIVLKLCIAAGLSRYRSDLSDVFEDLMDFSDCRKPMELAKKLGGTPSASDLFFLREICTTDLLEDSINFASCDEVEEERIALLQYLILHDSSRRLQYTDEIAAITKGQEVARLVAQFDRSRIYVDEAAAMAYIEPELRDAIGRYRQLLVEPALGLKLESIERRLRELLKTSVSDLPVFHLPSTEREGVFRALYQLVLDAFALSPNHGFQTYLSTRILHGSLEGELRSSFSSRALLFSEKEEDAAAQFHASWAQRLPDLTETEMARAARAITTLSSSVTKGIRTLKKQKIRVSTTDTPEGIFFANPASDQQLQDLQQKFSGDSTYEEIVARLIDHFWGLLDRDLATVRELLEDFGKEATKQTSMALQRLAALQKPHGELSDAITYCQTAFNTDIERVSAWFTRPTALSDSPFSIETAVQVATKITNNCYPNFPVAPSVDHDSALLDGPMLNATVDFLANCFHNAIQHSGVSGRAPKLEIVSTADQEHMKVCVRSELDASTDVDMVRRAIDHRLLDLENETAVMNEGGSGLRKMRRIVKYDLRAPTPLKVTVDPEGGVQVTAVIPTARRSG